MGKGSYGGVVRHIHTLLNVGAMGGLTDAQLLERFVLRDGQGAEQAFAALVERHAAIVLRTCRARLGDEHAAQDAVQATFLVLACRAESLGVHGSLGPWLHSVAWRVASSARAAEARRRRHERRAAEAGRGQRIDGVVDPNDWESVLHEEIDRLAERYRKPMVLCGLGGLTTAQAALQLDWPVGTVRSRLARGRERLRVRLVRRGLAPAIVMVGGLATAEGAQIALAVPAAVAVATVQAAMRGAACQTVAGVAPVAVALMAKSTLGSMAMKKGMIVAAAILAVGASTFATAVVLARAGDADRETQATLSQEVLERPAQADLPVTVKSVPHAALSLADQLEAIQAEYEAKNLALWAAQEKTANPREQNELFATMSPDTVDYCRRMIELASIAPNDPAAREALLWVIDHPGRTDTGTYGDEFARAAARLVRDHGNDPDAVRIGLQLDHAFTIHRDQLLAGFFAAAKGHEAKGLARLALAQYLERKAQMARSVRLSKGRQINTFVGVVGDDGKPHDVKHEQSDEEYAYTMILRQCDPDGLQTEAERLFQEVIENYGDVACVTRKLRKLDAMLKQPRPQWNGQAMTEETRAKLMQKVASPSSLAKVAGRRLDAMRNLVAGKPAPEIDGFDFDGNPLKLSDYRGKVVALSFWGSWCGPCMRDVPRERELVKKYQGRPFAMLGVNCHESKLTAAKVIKSERMTWPNWHDSEEANGPIASRYHIGSYPTVFVIDADGMIRSTKASGENLEQLVEQLVQETETNHNEM